MSTRDLYTTSLEILTSLKPGDVIGVTPKDDPNADRQLDLLYLDLLIYGQTPDWASPDKPIYISRWNVDVDADYHDFQITKLLINNAVHRYPGVIENVHNASTLINTVATTREFLAAVNNDDTLLAAYEIGRRDDPTKAFRAMCVYHCFSGDGSALEAHTVFNDRYLFVYGLPPEVTEEFVKEALDFAKVNNRIVVYADHR